MFAKRDRDGMPVEPDKIETIIGKETEFKGTLNSSGAIRIDGRVEGEIHHRGDLVVGEGGIVWAHIKARNVTIAGEVKGNIEAEGRLEIVTTGKLFGDIKVENLIIGDGAVFRGMSEMKTGDDKAQPPKPRLKPEEPQATRPYDQPARQF